MSEKAPAPIKCDVCNQRDGWKGYEMIRCTSCNVYVHKDCYGWPTYKGSTFKCWACQSVGQRFQVEKYNTDGEHISIKQKSRPTRCELCCVSDGIHAMHPLYDRSGNRARQIHIKDPNTMQGRLAWTHTLCAFVLTGKGFLYGCAPDGGYDADDSDVSEDERSCNPDFEREIDGDFGDYLPVHHFAYPIKKPGRPHSLVTKAISEHQEELKCEMCGKRDSKGSVLRIPLQCFAHDPDECENFKNVPYRNLTSIESCTCAAHVGCSRWKEYIRHGPERVFFDPAEGDCGVYCKLHAQDIASFEEEKKHSMTKEKNRYARQPRESYATAERPIMKGNIPRAMSKKRPPSTFNSSASSNKKMRRGAPDETVLDSIRDKYPEKKKRGNFKTASAPTTAATARAAKKRNDNDLLGQQLSQKFAPKKKKKWHDGFDRNEAVAPKDMQRPKLKDNRRELANKRSVVDDSMYEKVLADLKEKAGAPSMDLNDRNEVVKGRKTFWKRSLSELTSENFKEVWKKAFKALKKYIIEKQNSDVAESAAAAARKPPPPAAAPAPATNLEGTASKQQQQQRLSYASEPIRRKSPATVDLTLDDDPSFPMPTENPRKARNPVESTKERVERPKDASISEPEEIGGDDNDVEKATRKVRNVPGTASHPKPITTNTSNLISDRISPSHSEPKLARDTKPREKQRERENPFASLTIGTSFQLGKEFDFDSWDELNEEVFI